MGDLGPFALLAIVWWVISMIGEGRKRQQRRTGPPAGQRPLPRAPARRLPSGDPSQVEGTRLEQLLREMEKALDPAATRPVPAPSPSQRGGWDAGEDDVEEREALDSYRPRIENHDDPASFERPERKVVVLGGDPEELQRRRMQYAEVRTHALTKADHQRFDAEIRRSSQPAIVTPGEPASARVERLRQAIIWREVLGPPVALRGEEWF